MASQLAGADTNDFAGPYLPRVLREYALLADGERGILAGPRGDFAWMCAPRFDSVAVSSTFLGGGGLYAVTPAEERFVWAVPTRRGHPSGVTAG